MTKNKNNNQKEKIRVVTFLCRKQIDYLDRMGKDALFSGGKKLSRAQLLAELVDMLIKSNISIGHLELNNNGELSSELLKALRQSQGRELRGQKSEVRGQRSEDRGQKEEVRRQKAEDRGQRTEDRGQRTDGWGERR